MKRAFFAAALTFVGSVASAQGVGSALGGNCTNKKLSELCGGSPMGSPEFSACATKRLAEASSACQTMRPGVIDPRVFVFDPKNPCEEDRRHLCPSTPSGSADAVVCLAWFRKHVSPVCAATLPKDAKQEPEIVSPKPPAHFHQEYIVGRCTDDDIKTFCPDMTGLAVNDCLVQHEAEVSKRCKILIADMKHKRRVFGACKAEIKKNCDDTKTADEALICLYRAQEGGDVFSAPCKNALPVRTDD